MGESLREGLLSGDLAWMQHRFVKLLIYTQAFVWRMTERFLIRKTAVSVLSILRILCQELAQTAGCIAQIVCPNVCMELYEAVRRVLNPTRRRKVPQEAVIK